MYEYKPGSAPRFAKKEQKKRKRINSCANVLWLPFCGRTPLTIGLHEMHEMGGAPPPAIHQLFGIDASCCASEGCLLHHCLPVSKVKGGAVAGMGRRSCLYYCCKWLIGKSLNHSPMSQSGVRTWCCRWVGGRSGNHCCTSQAGAVRGPAATLLESGKSSELWWWGGGRMEFPS